MFEVLKKNHIMSVSQRQMQKENFVTGLRETVSAETLRIQAVSAVQTGGKVYGFYDNRNQCVICWIIRKAGKNYILDCIYIASGYEEKTNELNQILKAEMQKLVNFTDIRSVNWEVIRPKEESESHSLLYMISFAVIFSMIFPNKMLGVCIGLSIGSALGSDLAKGRK